MKETVFEGVNVIYFKIIERSLISNKSNFYQVHNWEAEKVRVEKSGKFKILKEKQIAIELLNKGKGIIFREYVIFKNDKNNILLKEYNMEYSRKIKDYMMFMDGEVYRNVKEVYHIPLIKAVIKMYTVNLITSENLKNKLNKYFNQSMNINIDEFILKIDSQKEVLFQS